jgi:hypothetical protein
MKSEFTDFPQHASQYTNVVCNTTYIAYLTNSNTSYIKRFPIRRTFNETACQLFITSWNMVTVNRLIFVYNWELARRSPLDTCSCHRPLVTWVHTDVFMNGNLLSPCSRVLLEKLTGFSASQEIPLILWKSKVHYRVYNCPLLVSVSSQIIPSMLHIPIPEDRS